MLRGTVVLRLGGQPTVHGHDRAVHVRRFVGHQEADHARDLLQVGRAADRRLVEVVGASGLGQVRGEDPRLRMIDEVTERARRYGQASSSSRVRARPAGAASSAVPEGREIASW